MKYEYCFEGTVYDIRNGRRPNEAIAFRTVDSVLCSECGSVGMGRFEVQDLVNYEEAPTCDCCHRNIVGVRMGIA